MDFVRTHTILSMLKGYPNIQPFDLEPTEVRGQTLDAKIDESIFKIGSPILADKIIDGLVSATLALRRHSVVHPDFSLKNFKLVGAEPILCNFEGCWLEEKYNYLPALQRCIKGLLNSSIGQMIGLYAKHASCATSLKQLAMLCDIPVPSALHKMHTFQFTTRHNAIVVDQLKWLWNNSNTREFVAMLHQHTEITEELYDVYQQVIYERFDKPRVINYLVGNCANIRAISNDWVWEPVSHLPMMSECKFDVYQMFSVVQGLTRAYAALEYWGIIHPFTIDCFRIRNGCEPVLCDFNNAYIQKIHITESFMRPLNRLLVEISGCLVPYIQGKIKIKRSTDRNAWTDYLDAKPYSVKNKLRKFIGRHMSSLPKHYNYYWHTLYSAVMELYETPTPQAQL